LQQHSCHQFGPTQSMDALEMGWHHLCWLTQ
jgi:hypothetical protein